MRSDCRINNAAAPRMYFLYFSQALGSRFTIVVPGGKSAWAKMPSLEFIPVDNILRGHRVWHILLGQFLAGQYLLDYLPRLPAHIPEIECVATHHAKIDHRAEGAIYRCG